MKTVHYMIESKRSPGEKWESYRDGMSKREAVSLTCWNRLSYEKWKFRIREITTISKVLPNAKPATKKAFRRVP